MPEDKNAYVLEISRQASTLRMGIFERSELSSTIKHYSQLNVAFPQINRICQEITSILASASKTHPGEPELLAQMKKAGQFLYDHLLTSHVKNRLKTKEFKELVLSLDEDLIDIPWELLYDGKDFFCLKFNLGRLVGTRQRHGRCNSAHPARY